MTDPRIYKLFEKLLCMAIIKFSRGNETFGEAVNTGSVWDGMSPEQIYVRICFLRLAINYRDLGSIDSVEIFIQGGKDDINHWDETAP